MKPSSQMGSEALVPTNCLKNSTMALHQGGDMGGDRGSTQITPETP
jgi:hypothetical protein